MFKDIQGYKTDLLFQKPSHLLWIQVKYLNCSINIGDIYFLKDNKTQLNSFPITCMAETRAGLSASVCSSPRVCQQALHQFIIHTCISFIQLLAIETCSATSFSIIWGGLKWKMLRSVIFWGPKCWNIEPRRNSQTGAVVCGVYFRTGFP